MATYQGAAYNGDQYAGQPLTSQVQVPLAPFNLAVTRYAQPILLISWISGANADTFEIQRSPDGSTSWASLASGFASPNYLDTTTTWGFTYYYRVRGTNAAGTSPWSSTLSATIPNGDDGDWLYLNADVIPTLVEKDGDWIYLHADVIPNLVESDGDRLYINANVQPSTVAVGFIMDAPVGTLYMYGTAPAVGFIMDAPVGQPLQFIPGLPVGFILDAPVGDILQLMTALAAGFVMDAPAGDTQIPSSFPPYAVDNVGFTAADIRDLIIYAVENVGYSYSEAASWVIGIADMNAVRDKRRFLWLYGVENVTT